MGEHEEWAQPGGLLPNGLLPDESSSVIRTLNGARWSKAEQRTAELISCIKPNPLSDEQRKAVVDYVERLIKECFQCQVKVFTFGSVPLKTYLPDGDIDLSAFSEDQNLKDTWALKVRDILQKEEQNVNAEFQVKEVQYIQAEVKIIKCLVENIVVDISFNQLGGLCTLCFLEAVDHSINQNYLFKRSIILIKAWCYYESRILGAHHGLISTYALEILVLYIFHVFNNTFAGPLEVLYRFLEFFSNFDWDNFCVSLWGPVPVSSLPDITAEPPRKDSGKLVLSKLLLEACSTYYFVDNQGPSFVSKHFNVIDPLRVNNNLGRSVSKGNFFRIRSAFAFGAKRLRQLLDCSDEDVIFELDQFFMNTWERHGNGNRPDAPSSDLLQVRSSNPHCVREHDDNVNTNSQRKQEQPSGCELVVEGSQSNTCLTHCSSSPLESKSMTNDISSVSCAPALKVHTNVNSLRVSSRSERGNLNHSSQADKSQRSLKPSTNVNEQIPGKHLFTRTRSSPDLTDTHGDSSGRARHSKVVDNVKHQIYAMRTDNRRKKDIASETISSQSNRLSSDDIASRKQASAQQQIDVAVDSDSASNYHPDDSSIGSSIREEHVTVGVHGMQQAEQDLVNMMSSMRNFGGQVPMPLNLASTRPPLSFSPSMMASLFYGQRNFAGMVPGNIPLVEPPWGPNLQLPQNLISSPLTQYFPGIGLKSNMEDTTQQVTEKYVSAEMVHEESHNDGDRGDEKSSGRYASGDGSLEIPDSDDRQPSTSGDSSFIQPHQFGGSGFFARTQSKLNRENRGSVRDERVGSIHLQDNRAGEAYSDDGSEKVVSSISQASLLRSKSSSGSSWDGSSLRPLKSTREKRGKRTTASSAAVQSNVYGKGRSISEHNSSQETDDESKDRNSNTTDPEIVERSTLTQPEAIVHPFRTHLSGYDTAQTSGSDSLVPMSPMLLGPGSRPSITDNSGMLPLTFYPTGPPVPFLAMLPVYNFPTNGGSSDAASTGHLSREEGVEHNNLNQSLESCSALSDTGDLNMSSSTGRTSTTGEQLDEPKDILHSDFVSHWQNLQYGRICQKPRYHVPVVYPSPVVVPPIYLQGRMPWDGPGRPNVNHVSPIMSYGPRILPVAPLQPISNRTPAVYQRYVDDLPRHRGGTGTYLPNLKTRDKHSSGTRRNSYNFDRNDNHADREGNWNAAKARSMWRSQHRNQTGKSSSRLDDSSTSGSRADRPWSSHRHEPSLPTYYTQNGPVRPNSSQGASGSIAYGMYPVPGINPNGLSANGPNGPPVVMLYQYDHNSGYVPHSEPIEFGSVSPVSYMSSNEGPPVAEGTQTRGPFEEQRFHGSSQMSSPDQPSSPHVQKHFIY